MTRSAPIHRRCVVLVLALMLLSRSASACGQHCVGVQPMLSSGWEINQKFLEIPI